MYYFVPYYCCFYLKLNLKSNNFFPFLIFNFKKEMAFGYNPSGLFVQIVLRSSAKFFLK